MKRTATFGGTVRAAASRARSAIPLLGCALLVLGAITCSHRKADLRGRTYESVEILTEAVDDAVADPERATRAKETLMEAEAAIRAFHERMAQLRREMYELARDYDAKPAEFERLFARMKAVRAEHRERLIGHAMSARHGLSEAEWAAITGTLLAERED